MENSKLIYIYTLSHPITTEIRYVGKTINPSGRLREHITHAKLYRDKTHKGNWIRRLLRNELRPVMTTIQETTEQEWEQAEKYWIQYYKDKGYKLTNSTDGGDGTKGHKHKKRTKKLLSEIAIKAHKNGSHPHFFGKQTQEFIYKRIGNRIENIKKGKQQINSTKIVAINTETKEELVFNSIAQAALALNLKYNRVSDASRGQLGKFKNRHNHKQFEFYRLE